MTDFKILVLEHLKTELVKDVSDEVPRIDRTVQIIHDHPPDQNSWVVDTDGSHEKYVLIK